MKWKVNIEAGICGFHTAALVRREDEQYVVLDVETDCEKLNHLSSILKETGPKDITIKMTQD